MVNRHGDAKTRGHLPIPQRLSDPGNREGAGARTAWDACRPSRQGRATRQTQASLWSRGSRGGFYSKHRVASANPASRTRTARNPCSAESGSRAAGVGVTMTL